MKLLLSFLLFLIPFIGISQDIPRQEIVGKIVVEGKDIEGITIYNASANQGTITDKNGVFTIEVAVDDIIEIRALVYQDIDVKVNKAVIDSKRMSVYLIEEMNMLDEVSIPKKELSGNLVTDVNQVETYHQKLDVFYFGMTYDQIYALEDDSESQMRYLERIDQGTTLVNGLDVVNIVDQLLIPLFRSEVKNKKEVGVPEVPAENIKYYLGSDFLVENFDIPEHRVEEFIRYVEDDTFDYDLLNYGHEIELLDLLSRKSRTFLQAENTFE